MKLLLDTHALLWALEMNPRLSARARDALTAPDVATFVSPVSAYEINLKHNLGKLPGAALLAADFAGTLAPFAYTSLPVTLEHAARAGALDLVHKDPFDRILAAQAIVEGMQIVSTDTAFDRLGAKRIWWP